MRSIDTIINMSLPTILRRVGAIWTIMGWNFMLYNLIINLYVYLCISAQHPLFIWCLHYMYNKILNHIIIC